MRSVALLIFLSHFILYNSLPLETTTAASRLIEEESHSLSIAGGLTPAARAKPLLHPVSSPDNQHFQMENELQSPKQLGPITENQPKSPASTEKSSFTPSSQTSFGSPQTFSLPRTSSDGSFAKTPGTVSTSPTEEFSLGEKPDQTSLEATSQRVRRINYIYRQLLSAVGKPQVQLQKKTYWDHLTTYLNRVKAYLPVGRPRTLVTFNEVDASKLKTHLMLVNRILNDEDANVLDKYYQAFSASNKKPIAMIKSNPDTYDLLSEWEKTHQPLRSVFRNFFNRILPDGEALRREHIHELQREQFRIVRNWEREENTISQSSGMELKDVQDFGKMLGGKDFFPAFGTSRSTTDLKRTLDQIKDVEEKNPSLVERWKHYLKPDEYKARLELLTTLSTIQNPGKIPSQTVSAWRAQGLDVSRMLKIVDEIPAGSPDLVDAHFPFDNLKKSSRELFLHKNAYGTPWLKSLEHRQLLQIMSPDEKLKYVERLLNPNEFNARLDLAEKYSTMQNHDKISWQTISKWAFQGLDVDRMLNIVDEIPSQTLDARYPFDTIGKYQLARKLFLPNNSRGKPWSESHEHDQLLQIMSEDRKALYLEHLELLQELENHPPRQTPADLLPAKRLAILGWFYNMLGKIGHFVMKFVYPIRI